MTQATERQSLDLNSKGLTGDDLFNRVFDCFTKGNFVDEFDQKILISQIDVFIDGDLRFVNKDMNGRFVSISAK